MGMEHDQRYRRQGSRGLNLWWLKEENMGLNVGAGQYMCINSQSSEEDQKAAEEFLVWLFSSDTGKELVSKKLQFVTPFSTMEEAEYDNPLFASQSAIAAAGKTRILLGFEPDSGPDLEGQHGRRSAAVRTGPDGMGRRCERRC